MNEGSEIPSDDELVFIVQLHLKPERVEDWKRAVNEPIDRMSQEEAFVRNQMKDYRKRYEEMLPDLLQAPRKAMTLRPVQAWHR
jgi:hypothetical protein